VFVQVKFTGEENPFNGVIVTGIALTSCPDGRVCGGLTVIVKSGAVKDVKLAFTANGPLNANHCGVVVPVNAPPNPENW
jgi:hypothetical protein